MKGKSLKTVLISSASAILFLSPGGALAQASTDSSDEGDAPEIVVTARRVGESINEVPLAISAVTSEQLDRIGARSLDEVSRFTPGFNFERTNGSLAQPVMRGQAQTRVTNPVQNVATFFNGIYLQRSYQVDSDLLELDRVEVIKGPQSALFGRNAFSGAISIVSRKPDFDDFRGKIEGTIGNHARREIRGSVSIPIGGIAAFSVAGSVSDFDGTWRNENAAAAGLSGPALLTSGRLNGFENRSVLAQLAVRPFDALQIDAFWSHRKISIETPPTYQMSSTLAIRAGNTMNCVPFAAPRSTAANGANALFCGSLPVRPLIAAGEARPAGILIDRRSNGQEGKSDVAGVTAAFNLTDSLSLTYQFGYTKADATNVATLSGDPINGSAFPFFRGQVLFDSRGNGDIESFTHELRAEYNKGPVRVLIGGLAGTVDDFSFGGTAFLTPNSTTPVLDNITTALSGFGATQRDERNRAIFGLVSISPLEGLTVSAEARQAWERITQQGVSATGALIGARFREEFSIFTPRFTVDYKPSDNWLIYASAAKGAKVGGFNVPTATNPLTAAQQIFLPESNWTYELGVKAQLLDRRLSLEAALYHTDWTNLQGNQAVNLGQPAIIQNLAGANINGFEVSAVARPSDALTFNFGLAFADAEFAVGTVDDTIPRALCTSLATCPTTGIYSANIAGRDVPRAPKWQANAGVQYQSAIGSLFGNETDFIGRIDLSHIGRTAVDNSNTAFVGGRELVDASLGLSNDRWSLRFWAKNIFDKEYVSYSFTTFAGSGAGSGVTYGVLLGDRRTFGSTLSINF